jgi:hypothetical protein
MMNVLQNLNIKRDTLEKRVYIPDHFKPKQTVVVSQATKTPVVTQAQQPINSQHYDNQYLPSSLRNNHNPFSITAMNIVPVPVPDVDKQVISSVLGGGSITESATGSGIPIAADSSAGGNGSSSSSSTSSSSSVEILPSADYNLTQKEVTIL